MKVTEAWFFQEFIDSCDLCCRLGWNERNGGNMSYRIQKEDVESVKESFSFDRPWTPIGVSVPNLAGEIFIVTGSGKYFRYTKADPENSVAITEIDDKGENYRILWGLQSGGRPTSEFPTHLLNHSVKKDLTNGVHRLVMHVHPVNTVALTFVLPQDDKIFTREIWEMMPECAVVFPRGIGVLPLMLTGSIDIAKATAEKFRTYDVVVWSMHGIFASGEDFKGVFGIIETVEKAADILVRVISMGGKRIRPAAEQIVEVCDEYHLDINKAIFED